MKPGHFQFQVLRPRKEKWKQSRKIEEKEDGEGD